MLELAMICSLALMGIYFFKSTDLPKELKERSAQLSAEVGPVASKRAFKITIPNEKVKTAALDHNQGAKLAEMKQQKKLKEIQLLNQEIDRLTVEITTLEQEIRANNDRNAEIQTVIDSHLLTLQSLQEKITILA